MRIDVLTSVREDSGSLGVVQGRRGGVGWRSHSIVVALSPRLGFALKTAVSGVSKCSVIPCGRNEREGWTDEGYCHTLVQRDALEAQLFSSLGGTEHTVRNSAEALSVV